MRRSTAGEAAVKMGLPSASAVAAEVVCRKWRRVGWCLGLFIVFIFYGFSDCRAEGISVFKQFSREFVSGSVVVERINACRQFDI